MTPKRILVFVLSVLTAISLIACGRVELTSSTEGIQTFGMDVDPSAQPSVGQTAPEVSTENNPIVVDPTQTAGSVGQVVEGNTTTSTAPSPTASSAVQSAEPTASSRPSSGGGSSTTARPKTSDAPVETETPVSSPAISPPEPASTAKVDEAYDYVGASLSELIDAVGLPLSSDYEDVDEGDPDTERIGTLRYDGFTVVTRRTADGETVTSVKPN